MAIYNLESSQTDRINFDQIQERYAEAMLNALPLDLAMDQDPAEYANVGWENFEIDLEFGTVQVDNIEEAKARFMDAFIRAVREWQKEQCDNQPHFQSSASPK